MDAKDLNQEDLVISLNYKSVVYKSKFNSLGLLGDTIQKDMSSNFPGTLTRIETKYVGNKRLLSVK